MAKMKLITKALEKKLPTLSEIDKIFGEMDGNHDELTCHACFFTPTSRPFYGTVCDWYWYAVAYDPINKLFFGWVDGIDCEWGYFSLDELENVELPFYLSVERYSYWPSRKMKDIAEYQQWITKMRKQSEKQHKKEK